MLAESCCHGNQSFPLVRVKPKETLKFRTTFIQSFVANSCITYQSVESILHDICCENKQGRFKLKFHRVKSFLKVLNCAIIPHLTRPLIRHMCDAPRLHMYSAHVRCHCEKKTEHGSPTVIFLLSQPKKSHISAIYNWFDLINIKYVYLSISTSSIVQYRRVSQSVFQCLTTHVRFTGELSGPSYSVPFLVTVPNIVVSDYS